MLATGPQLIQPAAPRQTRFGNAATAALAERGTIEASRAIAHLGTAKAIQAKTQRLVKVLNKIPTGGMSIEDLAARFLTVIGVYIPQAYFSIKEDKHIWETNGRNVVVWLMTLGVTWLSKSPRYGLNPLLDRFMGPKKDLPPTAGLFERFANRFRLDMDYFDIVEKAEEGKVSPDLRKGAFWSELDKNRRDKIDALPGKLKAELEALEGRLANISDAGEKALLEKEKAALEKMQRVLPKLQKRLNLFPMLSTTIITAATVWLIGGFAMKLVYKFIAPFDHDFDPDGAKSKAMKNLPLPAPSFQQPSVFQSFAAGHRMTQPNAGGRNA